MLIWCLQVSFLFQHSSVFSRLSRAEFLQINTFIHRPWQVCAHGSHHSTLSPSSWPTVTYWTTWGSATERRSMQWCCSTWPRRSPLPWSTWRRKTSYTGECKDGALLFFEFQKQIRQCRVAFLFFIQRFVWQPDCYYQSEFVLSRCELPLFFSFFPPFLSRSPLTLSSVLAAGPTSQIGVTLRNSFWHVLTRPFKRHETKWFMCFAFAKADF